MKKKLLGLVLSAAMAVSLLAGCASSGTAAATAETSTEAETAAEASDEEAAKASEVELDAYDQAIAERKAQVEETGVYPKVVFSFYDWTGTPVGTQRIQDAMNEILRERLGLEVELMILDSAAYSQDVRLMLSSGEQVDWINSCSLGYSTVVNNGYCYDLEEDDLIQKYGPGILQTLDPSYIQACRVNGTLYGLPQMRDMAMTVVMCVAKEYLDGIGYEYEEDPSEQVVKDTTWEEIDDLFAQLHEAYPDKYVFAAGKNLINQGSIADGVGGDYFGVLTDPVNSLTVENLYTSDLFKQKCQMVYNWNQLGYISKDALNDDTSYASKFRSGNYMSLMCQGKPGYKAQISAECGMEMVVFEMKDEWIMKSNAVTGILWNMNQNCEDPVAAMQLMNELFVDPELSNLIIWGQEGTDYVFTEDGHITFPEGVSSENAEYYHTMNWMLPNQFIAHIWEGDNLDLWERMKVFNSEAPKSKALGFMFDNSEYAAEFTAISNVYDELAPQVLLGFVEPEAGIAELEEKMESAGLLDYIAAKQAALDEWAKANGVE